MKQLFPLVLFMIISISSFSQNKFGIATYTAPAGWQLTEEKSSVTLERKTENGICRISLFATDMTVGVLTANEHTRYRGSIGLKQVTYSDMKGAIKKSEANGMTAFSSHGSGSINNVPLRNSFYSFTNGRQSFFVQLTATNNNCITAFNSFLENLLIDEVEEKSGSTMNAKRKKVVTPAPADAAPAM